MVISETEQHKRPAGGPRTRQGEKHMTRETLRHITIHGQKCTLYYESYFWHVWVKGKGTVGIGTNAEDAIKDARKNLSSD